MATDFISRKDAKDKHCEICEHLNICYQYDGDDCRTYTGRTCIERQCFNTIPAAKVQPVVRGKWKANPHIGFKRLNEEDEPVYAYVTAFICTNCEKRSDKRTDFCPNCGADMRGGDEDG